MEEKLLIQQLKKGNQQVFGFVVDKYASMVFSLVYKMIENKEDTEDITQEVFTTLWITIESFKGESLLKTWIYRIAINKTHEFIRRKNRQKRKGSVVSIEDKRELGSSLSPTPHEIVEYNELQELFQRSLMELTENQQTAFLLNRFEGLSYHEIAEEMNMSHSAVESLIFRAKQKLTILMKKS